MPRRLSVGVDIGSSAVRAAAVATEGGKRELVRFAQVGLPDGAVVEGEVRDRPAVTAALKRLWVEGGFRRREVVLGVSSQRAMVRVLEMPAVDAKELRSALRYEIGDLLPIPVDQAVYDFAVLGPGKPSGDGAPTTQVLVVVAQKDIVRDQIEVAKRAGLRPRAVDASPLALLRAVPSAEQPNGLDAVVSIGADLVVVAVRQGPVPRFVRTATVSVESELAVVRAGAGARGAPAELREGLEAHSPSGKADPVVEEVRSSIEYFLSHAHGALLSRVQLTGGASRRAGLAERLAGVLGIPVVPAELALGYDVAELGLTQAQVEEASWRWTTAAGLALWGTVEGARSPSLVPAEVALQAQQRRAIVLAATGLVVVAGGLGVLSHNRTDATSSARAQAKADQQEAASLQLQIDKLQSLGEVQSQVQARRALAVQALSGDVDWVGLDSRIVRALPAGVSLTDISFSSSPPVPSTSPAGHPATPNYVGEVTITAQTTMGLPSVSQFVKAMSHVSGLSAVWVSSTSTAGQATAPSPGKAKLSQSASEMTFSATAEVTAAALGRRAATLPGGTK